MPETSLPSPERCDYLLIRGAARDRFPEILRAVRSARGFRILKIVRHQPAGEAVLLDAVNRFRVAAVAPLGDGNEAVPGEVWIVFLRNLDPAEDYWGEGKGRRLESGALRDLTARVAAHSPEGRGVAEIVASESEVQTDALLRYLGYGGSGLFAERKLPIAVPYHLGEVPAFSLRYVATADLRCNVVVAAPPAFATEERRVEETPHFRALAGDPEPYESYVASFLGTVLTDDHSLERLLALRDALRYLEEGWNGDYIVTKETEDGKFLVLDGVHRAAVLGHRGVAALHVAVVERSDDARSA